MSTRGFVYTLIISLAINVHANVSPLFPIQRMASWGYADQNGTLVVAHQFEEARAPSQGLAAVKLRNRWGFVDMSGDMRIPAQFSAVRSYSEGLAAVRDQAGWGFINAESKIIIPLVYSQVGNFRGGLAWVRDQKGRTYFMAGDGSRAFDASGFDEVSDFSENLAAVRTGKLFGFIDVSGTLIIPCIFESVSDFSEGCAVAYKGGKAGFIEKSGAWIIAPVYDAAGVFAEGFAPVKMKGKWGYICMDGSFLVNPEFDSAGPFSQGRAPIAVMSRWTFLDLRGRLIGSPKYQFVNSFSHGLARVVVGGEEGYIDESGKLVWGLGEYEGWDKVRRIELTRAGRFHELQIALNYPDKLEVRRKAIGEPEHRFTSTVPPVDFDRLAIHIHSEKFFMFTNYFSGLFGGTIVTTTVHYEDHIYSVRKHEATAPPRLWTIDLAIEALAFRSLTRTNSNNSLR